MPEQLSHPLPFDATPPIKIRNIEVIPVELPLVREHRMAYTYKERIGKFSIVKITTDDGLVGWGEAPTEMHWGGDYGSYYGESQKTTLHVIKDFLEPILKTESPLRLQVLQEKMDQKVRGYPYAKTAVEMALLDILGKVLRVPLFQLLFGLYREKIPVQHSIGLMSPEEAMREAALVVEEGIGTIKVKVGVESNRDVETVRQIRNAVGPDVQIRVDANRGYRSVDEALRTIRRMEPFNILLVEQPVEGLREMSAIAKRVDVPLMADEGVWSPQDVVSIYEHGAAQMLNVYITKSGGLMRAKKLLHVAATLGFVCGLGGMVELGVGTAANLHFGSSSPEITLACGVSVPYPGDGARKGRIACSYYKDTLEANPPEFKDGYLKVPTEPGLGIELDPTKIEKYRVF
jgi:muconate cycloisomerase